jgi:hypothetical protein
MLEQLSLIDPNNANNFSRNFKQKSAGNISNRPKGIFTTILLTHPWYKLVAPGQNALAVHPEHRCQVGRVCLTLVQPLAAAAAAGTELRTAANFSKH